MPRKTPYPPKPEKAPVVARNCPLHQTPLVRPAVSAGVWSAADYCPRCKIFWNVDGAKNLRDCIFIYLREKQYRRDADPFSLQAAQNEIEAFFFPALKLSYEQKRHAVEYVVHYIERRELAFVPDELDVIA